ncbi:MAG: hypothetical protein ACOWWH_13535 [Eubacteriaceae bacterium]
MKIADELKFDRKDNSNSFYFNNSWIYWYVILSSGNNNAFDRSMTNAMESTGSSSTGGFSAGGGGAGRF